MKRFTRTVASVALTALGAAGLAVAAAAPAQAAVLGSVTVSPTTGTDSTSFSGSLVANCPDDTGDSFFTIQGPDLAGAPDYPGSLGGGTATGDGPQSFSGASIANLRSTTPAGSFTTTGTYSIRFNCVANADGQVSDYYEALLSYTVGGEGSWTIAAVDADTTTSLTATPAGPVEQGTAVTLAADVTPTSGPDTGLTGTVEFLNGTTSLGAATAVSGTGTASLTVSNLPLGANSITARYVAGAGFNDSTSSPVTVQVNPVPARSTTSALTVSPTSGAAYQPVTLTCAVTASSGTATGTVRFLDGATQIATSPLTAGSAAVTTSSLGPGAHSLTCDYPGQAPYTGSTSVAVTATYEVVGAQPDPQTVVVTIPAGALTITTPYTPEAPLDLGTAVLDQATSTYSASAAFDRVTITDTRAGDLGFEASLVAGDFVNGASSFPGRHAGFTDVTAVQVAGNALPASSVVTTSTEPVTPGIGTPTKFADLAPGISTGSVQVTATFEVAGVPTSVGPGLYTSTVTFTAV